MKYNILTLILLLFPMYVTAQNSTKIVKASSIPKYRVKEIAKAETVKKKDLNDPVIQYETARNYMFGIGVEKNGVTAVEWLQKSAKQGNKDAQFELGTIYYFGLTKLYGINKDLKVAYEYYLKAAQQGHVSAQAWVGMMHENGEGVQRDWDRAVYWYKKAAAQGSEGAKIRLKESGIQE